MEQDFGAILAQLGGGAGAAVILTSVLRRTLDIPSRFLPVTAVVSGFVVSLLISIPSGVSASAAVLAFFAGLAAVGAYEAATTTTGN